MIRHPDPGRRRARTRPVAVITDAERGRDEQLRTRQLRYASMMGIRVICLVIAGVLVSAGAPMLWLWLPLCLIGMVLLPWMAVIIANDRLPREQHRLTALVRGGFRRPRGGGDRPLAGGRDAAPRAVGGPEPPVIDVEP